ncbi:MAG: N-acetyltransferase [Xanthomonadales bacterium]|nr:N-acetyltransferase [Xanthomonadales bacterium]
MSDSSLAINIRAERESDRSGVYALNASAFETGSEAKLVDSLRVQLPQAISMVAELSHQIVGHIMFTRVALSNHPGAFVMGLAPMAVAQPLQRKGIGSALVNQGLAACRAAGAGAAVVLGHPEYYPRFGFRPASSFRLGCEYDVPDEVFMAIELEPAYLSEKEGLVSYHELFTGV